MSRPFRPPFLDNVFFLVNPSFSSCSEHYSKFLVIKVLKIRLFEVCSRLCQSNIETKAAKTEENQFFRISFLEAVRVV